MYLKIVQYGNYLETYEYNNDKQTNRPRKKTKTVTWKRDISNTERKKRRLSNIYRTKKQFTRLILSNLTGDDYPVFCTLTTVSSVNIFVGNTYLLEFIRNLRKSYGTSFRYIAVPELQSRNAIHYHVLFWGLPDSLWLHEIPFSVRLSQKPSILQRFISWCNNKGYDYTSARGDRTLQHKWGRGFFDCIPTDGDAKLASYFSKYMQKSMLNESFFGSKAYTCSRNLLRPVQATVSAHFEDMTDAVQQLGYVDSDLVYQRDLDVYWLGKGRYRLYKNNITKMYDCKKSKVYSTQSRT
jgi:hypothetical protein